MMLKTFAIFLSALLLFACSNTPQHSRIGDIAKQPLPTLSLNSDIDNARQKAIEHYRRFVAEEEASLMRAEAKRRLTDIQMEMDEHESTRVIDELNDAIDVGDKTTQARLTNTAVSEVDYATLVNTYEELLTKYPDFKDTDDILYQLSKAYNGLYDYDKAMDMLNQLVQNYPDSVFYHEAQFRRGENLFLDGDFKNAALAYDTVLAAGDDIPFFEFALYKFGWAQFKQSNFSEAQNAFFTLLDRKFEHIKPEVNNFDELPLTERETVKDIFRSISLTFYYQDGPKTAKEFFYRSGQRDYEHLSFLHLAEFYFSGGAFQDAVRSYQAFIDRNPNHRLSPFFQLKTIAIWTKLADKPALISAKRALIKNYGVNTGYWLINDPHDMPVVVEKLQSTLEELASFYHSRAQQSKKPTDFQDAAYFYREYIKTYRLDPKTPHMNFLLAEALYEAQDYDGAITEYNHTAYDYPPHKDAPDAAYAALLAYRKHQPGNASDEEQAQWQQQRINSALRYYAAFPQHTHALNVLTQSAEELYYKLNNTALAIKTATTLTLRPDATPELQIKAYSIMAHAQFDQQNYLPAEAHYKEVLDRLEPRDKRRPDIIEAYAAAIYKQGEAKIALGQKNLAAEQFLRVHQLAPQSSIAATALYDAAATYISIENWPLAVETLEKFQFKYSKHKLKKDVRQKLAYAYMNNHQEAKAAREFELMSWREKNPDIQREALWQAALLFQKANEKKAYAKTLSNYIRRFPQPLEAAMDARQRLATLQKERGLTDRYHHWLKEIIKSHANAGDQATGRTQYLAASASLVLADTTLKNFNRIKLVNPIKKNLRLKRKYMKTSIKAYEKTAAYGVADVTTASTFRIAEIYHKFSADLMDSERPDNLDDLELEQYELMLEEQAIPFEDKAITLYEVNTGHTTDEGIYDRWIASSFKALGELFPARYNKVEALNPVYNALN